MITPSPWPQDAKELAELIQPGRAQKLPLATDQHFPSRGQTAVQELYQTERGKLFLKRTSDENHRHCQIAKETGSLAEREFWCYQLAKQAEIPAPPLWLLDSNTTLQVWHDLPDAHQFTSRQGKMHFTTDNVFDCALFDWITGQVDRHDGNYLYDFVRHRIILIDSANSLMKHDGSLPDYLKLFEVSNPDELQKKRSTPQSEALKAMKKTDLATLLPLRDRAEQDALFRRLEQIQTAMSVQDILSLYRKA